MAAQVLCLEDRTLLSAPFLADDIDPFKSTGGSNPRSITVAGPRIFFASTSITGTNELMVTDGTAAGSLVLRSFAPSQTTTDITPDSTPALKHLTNVNGTLYFVANDGIHGMELWKSDGTVAGTVLVKDITPGLAGTTLREFVSFNGQLFFQATVGSKATLWKSDGTDAGTVAVQSIGTAIGPTYLTEVNGSLFFTATTAASGRELWKTDGTDGGTMMVKDIFTGANSGGPFNLTKVDGTLFFAARGTGAIAAELWKSDGTSAGTVKVKAGTAFISKPNAANFDPDVIHSIPFTVMNGVIYFSASTGSALNELWRSDGTDAGTTLVKDIKTGTAGSFPEQLTAVGNTLYFVVTDDQYTPALWKSDGTTAGTSRVIGFPPGFGGVPSASLGELTDFNGTLHFTILDISRGSEIFKTNGTEAGTVRITDGPIAMFGPGTGPSELTVFNGKLYFSGHLGDFSRELMVTDGAFNNEAVVHPFFLNSGDSFFFENATFSSNPEGFMRAGSKLFFTQGSELWVAGGATGNAAFVKEFFGVSDSNRRYFFSPTDVNGTLYFLHQQSSSTGFSLWKSDGTTQGTVKFYDFPIGKAPTRLTAANGRLYFLFNDGSHGQELWSTDGTAAGTAMVADITFGTTGSSITSMNEFQGALYFTIGDVLWKTDGTLAATVVIKDTTADAGSSISNVVTFEDTMYFLVSGPTGPQIWKGDGTAAGTKSFVFLGAEELGSFRAASGRLYFLATTAVHGTELWSSDGTVFGTRVVKDIRPGAASTPITQVVVAHDRVYFVADDGISGSELWVSDGTAAGTMLLKDLTPGAGGTPISGLMSVNNRVYFEAYVGPYGHELWTSDGTVEGTQLVADINPRGNSLPKQMTVVGPRLYFVASTIESGRELWAIQLNSPPTALDLSATSASENLPAGTLVATLSGADPDDASNTLSFSLVVGPGSGGNAWFQIVGNELRTVTSFDFESLSNASIRVRATDPGGNFIDRVFTISVTDVNEAPTAVALTGATATLPENTAGPIELGTISVTDDALGFNSLSLSGADAGSFEIVAGKLRLRSGVGLNFELKPSYSVRINVNDPGVGGDLDAFADYTLTLVDVNEPPTAVVITGSNLLAESTATPAQIATFAVVDDALGNYQFFVSGPDSTFFELIGNGLRFKAGVVLDYEAKSTYSVVVNAFDSSLGGSVAHASSTWNVALTDDNEGPTALQLMGAVTSLSENAAGPIELATINIIDDALGTHTLSLAGLDAARFELVGNKLVLGLGVHLDYESQSTYTVRLNVDDPLVGGAVDAFVDYAFTLTDVNELPVVGVGGTSEISENRSTVNPIDLLTIVIADDALGTNHVSLSGPDASLFQLSGNAVQLRAGVDLDFESKPSYSIRINFDDPAIGGGVDQFLDQLISVTDVNEAPTLVRLTDEINSLPEHTSTPVDLGTIVVEDDALGTNVLTLSGPDAASFEIVGNTLRMRPGVVLDVATQSSYAITINVDDPGVGGPVDASIVKTLEIVESDAFDVGPITDTDPAPNRVLEHSSAGTPVGYTAFAIDLDATKSAITYSLWDTRGGRFAIDPVTGVVTIANGEFLDREVRASWSLTVLATSQDGSISVQEFTVDLVDVDEFNVGQVWDLDPAPSQVPEHSPAGTPVGYTAFAIDLDATNSAITYSLWDTRGGRFAIDPTTGVVTVANGEFLDREARASWSLTVLATSQDGSISVKEFTVDLIDVDEFNVGQVFDLSPAANTIVENCPDGTLVGITGFGIDLDATNNTVTYSLWNTRGGRFAINPATGVVTVANGSLIDREAQETWTITILATSSDGSVGVKDFTIAVQDVDEHNVGQVFDLDPSSNVVSEQAPGGTSVGITGFGIDLDATHSTVTYSLTDSAGGRFAIDPASGVVTVANGAGLDRETTVAWPITIQARSTDGSTSSKVFTVVILDADEFAVGPIDDANAAANVVSEAAAAGIQVGITANAVDQDATHSRVAYSLTNSAGGRFAIDSSTGVITLANPALLNREAVGAAASYDVTVRAISEDGSSSLKVLTIQVTDADEFNVGPVSDVNAAANTVSENAAAGTLAGITSRATDGDATNNSVTYSLSENAGGRFQIDPATGVVSVAAGAILDFETQTSHDITVQATSSDGSTSSQSFTITLANMPDGPRITLSGDRVAENRPSGTVVGTLGLADSSAASPVYSLVSGAGGTDNSKFTISGNQLKTRSSFDFETKSSYSIRVRMRAAGGVELIQVFTIQVTNANEGPTGVTLSPATIAENNAVGLQVGTLSAIDPDLGDAFNYSLVSGSGSTDNAGFTIEGNQLQAAEVFDYERRRSYSIRVRVTDAAGQSYEKTLRINVSNGPG